VFNGLLVRMGVASGLLPQDCKDVESSWVAARAASEWCCTGCRQPTMIPKYCYQRNSKRHGSLLLFSKAYLISVVH
jgi:hypothetical protein